MPLKCLFAEGASRGQGVRLFWAPQTWVPRGATEAPFQEVRPRGWGGPVMCALAYPPPKPRPQACPQAPPLLCQEVVSAPPSSPGPPFFRSPPPRSTTLEHTKFCTAGPNHLMLKGRRGCWLGVSSWIHRLGGDKAGGTPREIGAPSQTVQDKGSTQVRPVWGSASW